MDLLPEELRKALPPLYSQESSGSPRAYALCSTGHNRCYAPVAFMWCWADIASKTGHFPVAGLFSTEHNCDAPVG